MTGLVTKANSIATPVGFNPRDPASVAAAFAALPTNGRDVYGIGQSGGAGIIGPALEVERLEISTGPSLLVVESLYAPTLPAESFSLATGGVAEVFVGAAVPAAVVTIEGLAPVVEQGFAIGDWSNDVIATVGEYGNTDPSPVNNYYQRYLFHATYSEAEMVAALGGSPMATILGIRFLVTTAPDNQPFPGYAIGAKNTTSDISTNNSGSQGGDFVEVYAPKNQSFTSAAVNEFKFDTPIEWSGNNFALVWAWCQTVNYTTTGTMPRGNGSGFYAGSDDSGCYTITSSATSSNANSRPVLQFLYDAIGVQPPAASITATAIAPESIGFGATVNFSAATVSASAILPELIGVPLQYRYWRFDQLTHTTNVVEIGEFVVVNNGTYVSAGTWTINNLGGLFDFSSNDMTNGNLTNRAFQAASPDPASSIVYDHGSEVIATGFKYAAFFRPITNYITGVRVSGSNDGINYTVIKTLSGLTAYTNGDTNSWSELSPEYSF